MSIDIIGSNSINIPKGTQKVNNKNDEDSSTIKNQVVAQDLGTDTFVKSAEEDDTNSTYKPTKKKLSTEEISALKEDQDNFTTELIKKFISDTINNQNKLLGKSVDNQSSDSPKENTDLLSKIFGSVEKAYPPIATTKDEANKAISAGGAYSVTAVADRIMTMATFISGDDPVKLQKMREAVEKGFSQAGLDFSKATNSELPQICKDTCAEVMRRFDELQNKTDTSK